jgi:hypothetical protein
MTMITRMLTLTERNGHPMNITVEEGAWEVNPLFQPVSLFVPYILLCLIRLQGRACQTNGYDCGVWVLCTMAAFMRGYCSTGLLERDMGNARRCLMDHLLTLPTH